MGGMRICKKRDMQKTKFIPGKATRIIDRVYTRRLSGYAEYLIKKGEDLTLCYHWAEKFAEKEMKEKERLEKEINKLATDPFFDEKTLETLCHRLFQVDKSIIRKFLNNKSEE